MMADQATSGAGGPGTSDGRSPRGDRDGRGRRDDRGGGRGGRGSGGGKSQYLGRGGGIKPRSQVVKGGPRVSLPALGIVRGRQGRGGVGHGEAQGEPGPRAK